MRERPTPRPTELSRALGFSVTEFKPGSCVVECTVTELHLNMGGAVHGGIHATLLDTSMGGTLVSTISEDEWCATAQIDISYLNAVGVGSHLIAKAEVVRRGRTLAHMEGTLASEDGTIVATAKGTWVIWKTRHGNQENEVLNT